MLALLAATAMTGAIGDQATGTTAPAPTSPDTTITAPPVAASATPARPAILFNRWQEDWSVLAKAGVPHEPLDRLKHIPLSDDPATYLSLGANLRERFETNNAPSFGTNAANPRDSYVISRMEVHADLRAGPVQAFVQLQSAFAPGKQVHSAVDTNSLDLEQAFVALVEPIGPGTLKLRAGRQQFAFDLQRFVAARDGPNVRQSFDALWGDYEVGKWRFIGYYSRPVTNRDNRPLDDGSTDRNLFYGVRVERLVLGGKELRSIGQIARLSRVLDNGDLATRLRALHELCEEHRDVVTASLIENWLDETEGRRWFLFETGRKG